MPAAARLQPTMLAFRHLRNQPLAFRSMRQHLSANPMKRCHFSQLAVHDVSHELKLSTSTRCLRKSPLNICRPLNDCDCHTQACDEGHRLKVGPLLQTPQVTHTLFRMDCIKLSNNSPLSKYVLAFVQSSFILFMVQVLEGDSPYQCKECWKRAWREQKLKTLSFQTQERLLPHAPNRTRMENVQQSPAANQPTSKNGLHVVSEDAESSASDLGADADSEDEYDESKPASSATSTKGVQFYDHPLKQPSISLTPPPNFSTASFASPKKPPKSNRYIARKAYKRYLIDTLPPLLVFHLNRFQQSKPGLLAQSIGASMTGTLRKIDDFMSFPAVLDMSPFLAPAGKAPKIGRPVPPTESSTDNTEQEEDPSEADEKEGWRRRIFTGRKRSKTLMPLAQPEADPRLNQSKYRLTALVSHAGNMYSGKWYFVPITGLTEFCALQDIILHMSTYRPRLVKRLKRVPRYMIRQHPVKETAIHLMGLKGSGCTVVTRRFDQSSSQRC